MILFITLLITLIVGAIIFAVLTGVIGTAALLVFGDVIVCAMILWFIIRCLIKKK